MQLHVLYKLIFLQAQTKRARFIRDTVREVVGFAPYEKRMMELLRMHKDKRCLKFAKKRVSEFSTQVSVFDPIWHTQKPYKKRFKEFTAD